VILLKVLQRWVFPPHRLALSKSASWRTSFASRRMYRSSWDREPCASLLAPHLAEHHLNRWRLIHWSFHSLPTALILLSVRTVCLLILLPDRMTCLEVLCRAVLKPSKQRSLAHFNRHATAERQMPLMYSHPRRLSGSPFSSCLSTGFGSVLHSFSTLRIFLIRSSPVTCTYSTRPSYRRAVRACLLKTGNERFSVLAHWH